MITEQRMNERLAKITTLALELDCRAWWSTNVDGKEQLIVEIPEEDYLTKH